MTRVIMVNRLVIQPFSSVRIDMVDGVSLDKFTRSGDILIVLGYLFSLLVSSVHAVDGGGGSA